MRKSSLSNIQRLNYGNYGVVNIAERLFILMMAYEYDFMKINLITHFMKVQIEKKPIKMLCRMPG